MSDKDKENELVAEVKNGLATLHEKMAKYGNDSEEVKNTLSKVSGVVGSFESFKAASESKAKGDAERIELIEAQLAKKGATGNIDAKEIKGMIHEGLINADSRAGEQSIHELALKTRTATDSSQGGALITETLMMDMMITYMRDSNPMFAEADVRRFQNTSAIKIPRKTLTFGAAAAGELQEGRGKTKRNIELVTVEMNRYYSEDATTEEFLTAQNLEGESSIASDILSDLGVTIQSDALRGGFTGSKVRGLLNEPFLRDTAYLSSGQALDATKVTWKDLFRVQDKFNYEKYRNKGKFYMAFATLTNLLTEVDGEGRPIYMPGINGASQSTMAGSSFVIMPDMDKLLAYNTLPLLFGDMKAAYTIVVNGVYKTYRDDINGMRDGLITIGMSTFAGGGVKDEEAIRGVRGV